MNILIHSIDMNPAACISFQAAVLYPDKATVHRSNGLSKDEIALLYIIGQVDMNHHRKPTGLNCFFREPNPTNANPKEIMRFNQ